MAETDVNRRWQAEMSDFFVAGGPPDQSFLRITEIFTLTSNTAPAGLARASVDLLIGDDSECVT